MADSLPSSAISAPPPDLRLAAIVDSSDDAIVSKSLEGIITSWNIGAARIFGYEAEEVIGKHISILIPPDRLQEEPEILRRLQKGERVDHFETVRVRKDGRLVEISVTISPVRDASGTIIGASKIARDITAQKQAQREMARLLEQMKQADRMKVEFVATLSHELRTPLNAIIGWLEILKDTRLNPGELEEGLAAIERNARSQVQMIEDLLDMSRIETGKIALDLQSLDVPAVTSAAIAAIEPVVKAKEIRLTTAFDSINGAVMGDRTRLQQIIWNLLTNAVKFTPKGGRIHVTLERVSSHLELAVRDNGIGILEDILPVIFDRFRQADSSSTRRHGGLGLGLSIAKHLTELHGGQILVRSEGRDKGSVFIICLPVVVTHYEEARSTSEQRNSEVDDNHDEADLYGYRILTVDNDLDSLLVLKRILEMSKATVHAVSSVDDALAAIPEFRPHLILSDIGMPDRDGYDLVREVKKLSGGASIPMVALTALMRPEDRVRTLRSGFQIHLGKPVNPEELIAAVHNLLSLTNRA
ncbi:hybrid sensor histidine kinase/response regulator [Brevifollis gellanilyticus]|uniref:histidine kinase n=1 Tax=Brevifollis gellanilyticus TaxID=748831 RepID=A0A512MD08_9BACT|nr:PAS domain S-box protein [Brevifollis gellanilyticus]GEP44624.1 hybrid sensor histidine kinase/response regulator [Brevifollis gellanilyticus]